MTKPLIPPNLEEEVTAVRNLLISGNNWYKLNSPQRIAIIRDSRAKELSWRDIAEVVGLKRKNHSTIIQWARGKNGPPEFRKKEAKPKPPHRQQLLQFAETEPVDTQTLQEIVRGELQSTFKDLDLNNGIGLVFSANTTLERIQNHLDKIRSIRGSSEILGEELETTLIHETEQILSDLVHEINVSLKRNQIQKREIPDRQESTQIMGVPPPPPPPPPQSVVSVTLMPPSSTPTARSRYSWESRSLKDIIGLLLEIRHLSDRMEKNELSQEEIEELNRKELTSEDEIDMEMRLEKLLRAPSFSWEQFESIEAINVIPFSLRQNLDKPQKDAMKEHLVFLSKSKEEQEQIRQERERLRRAAEAQQANVQEMRDALAKREKLAHSIGGIHQADLQRELEKDATAGVTWWACLACENKFPFISTQRAAKPTVCPLCKIQWWTCDRCEELFPFTTTGEEIEAPVCPLCKTKEKGAVTMKLRQDPKKTGFLDYGTVVRGSAKISQEDIKNE
jgi:rubrerythrin